MAQIAYSQYVLACEAYDIDVYFEYNDSVLFSTEKETISNDGLKSAKCRELIIITKCNLEQYNGPFEVSRFCRGNILILQGIISFFTGFPLTVYNNYESKAGIEPIQYEVQNSHLLIEGVDYTTNLKKMLEKINEEPNLLITLLDRWRKAIYLKEESQDADLFYDEAILSFFHILELFGDCINKELKANLDNDIENFLLSHFKIYYFSEKQIKQKVEENKRSISSILIGDYLNLAVKIKFFLDKYQMLDDNIAFFVDSMIKIRNAIAHGRITYQDKFIWPLPPFFSLAKDSYENIEFLFFMTARMISKYIGITCWEQEWEEARNYLLPPKNTLDSFLNNDLIVADFNKEMLFDGNKYNINWRTIFNHYIKNPKKDFLQKIEDRLKKYFIETQIIEENAPDLFNISIVFSDSTDTQIQNKAVENVKITIANQWYGWSNYKDAYSYLEFYNVSAIWYKSFLDKREYLNCTK